MIASIYCTEPLAALSAALGNPEERLTFRVSAAAAQSREERKHRRAAGGGQRDDKATFILANDRDAIICLEGKIVPYVISLQKLHGFTIPGLDNSRSDCRTSADALTTPSHQSGRLTEALRPSKGEKIERLIKDTSSFLQLFADYFVKNFLLFLSFL